MCGIVGALVFDGSEFGISDAYLRRMRDTMPHRGPDGADSWIDPRGRVGLGHRRLSIIDLSTTASQPMSQSAGDSPTAPGRTFRKPRGNPRHEPAR